METQRKRRGPERGKREREGAQARVMYTRANEVDGGGELTGGRRGEKKYAARVGPRRDFWDGKGQTGREERASVTREGVD